MAGAHALLQFRRRTHRLRLGGPADRRVPCRDGREGGQDPRAPPHLHPRLGELFSIGVFFKQEKLIFIVYFHPRLGEFRVLESETYATNFFYENWRKKICFLQF